MTDDSDIRVERILELAANWQIADALTMLKEARQADDADDNREALRQLLTGASTLQEGHYETGIRDVLPALMHLERNGFRSRLAWAYSAVGFSLGILGSPETGLEWVGKAIVGAERLADESQLRRSLSDEAGLFAMLDENEKSISSYEKALELNNPPPTERERAGLLNNLAYTHLHFARRVEQDAEQRTRLAQSAMERANMALEILDEQGNERYIAWSLDYLGSALSLLGRFDEAEETFKKALPLSESFERINVELLTSYARLQCEMGRYEEADITLTRAYDQAQAGNQEASIDRILETRIRLEMLAGRINEALIWSERRFRMMESQYRNRLSAIARNAEIFAELEQARLAAHEAQTKHEELELLAKNLQQQTRFWQDEALKDSLTGCFNRRGLTALSASFLSPKSKTALALVDVDNFKQINDSLGHEIGDKVIQAVAQIIKKSFRDTDLITRYGDDEFLLLLHGIEATPAWGTCERLRLAIERFGWGTIAENVHVTVSIGIATLSDQDDLETLTFKADASLHRAKAEGRNKVVI
jgi:diguanylate cyclase (GGDEF)-like protein